MGLWVSSSPNLVALLCRKGRSGTVTLLICALHQLVGTGTAIAVAASGLVFGQPTEANSLRTRMGTLNAGEPGEQRTTEHNTRTLTSSSRPGTSSARLQTKEDGREQGCNTPHTLMSSRPPLSRYQRPQSAHFPPSSSSSRRPSFAGKREPSTSFIAGQRDSSSSNGSWMRRLSLRPLSQHGSPSSSVGRDASFTFSQGSAAPILSHAGPDPPALAPNKLVKRASSLRYPIADSQPPRRSKAGLPSLRRPATSHQRSATLHQFHSDFGFASPEALPYDHSYELPNLTLADGPRGRALTEASWTSFFHSRTTAWTGRGSPSRLSDTGANNRAVVLKRIRPGGDEQRCVHLVKPKMVSTAPMPIERPPTAANLDEQQASAAPESARDPASTEMTPSKTLHRSLSTSFSSAGQWVSKTSGSIRRPKRGAAAKVEGSKRHVSEPTGLPHRLAADPSAAMLAQSTTSQGVPADAAAAGPQLTNRKRNTSQPLPLSRCATAYSDSSRLCGSSSIASRPHQPSGSSTSSTAFSQLKVGQTDRASLLAGSETDPRDVTSGDDEDTDFKSDMLFDSFRTGASSHMRTAETSLDVTFDESPCTSGNSKMKRLSIQEILGKGWDEENKIMEEDESASTPARSSQRDIEIQGSHKPPLGQLSSPSKPSFTAQDFGRFSLDDEFDDEWAEQADYLSSPLSPPSKGSSVNSRAVSPNVRLALSNISGNSVAETSGANECVGRPLSNLFDWSETSLADGEGNRSRPKTAHAKQGTDPRGGRSAIRRGPAPTHIRSQSVPVVHDVVEDAKGAGAKYGTWGMSAKTASEDWEDDFEFSVPEPANDGKISRDLFAVPESIKASQPSVRAHSGQIRELSSLVNDLKRYLRRARDLGILDGPETSLWEEAEGIIALASPEEDDEEVLSKEERETAFLNDFDNLDSNPHFLGSESDAASLERLDAALEGREPVVGRTAVVRERQSPRRRSVFAPEDDIFGVNEPASEASALPNNLSQSRAPGGQGAKSPDVSRVVRSIVEAMQLRPPPGGSNRPSLGRSRMHFDTNNLKVLVKRASDLRDMLSDTIRRADALTPSPTRTPRLERHGESSPAFTRVFDDPGSTPRRQAQVTPVGEKTGLFSQEESPRGLFSAGSANMTLNGCRDTLRVTY